MTNEMKLQRSDFSLRKIKLHQSGSVEVKYDATQRTESSTHTDEVKTTKSVVPHPDLVTKIKSLKPFLLRVFQMTFFREISKQDDFKCTPEQSKILEKSYQAIAETFDVTGIDISGKEDNIGVIITSIKEVEAKTNVAVNTHRMKLDTIVYGFEEELQDIVQDIQDEAYEYAINDKQSQQSLVDEFEDE